MAAAMRLLRVALLCCAACASSKPAEKPLTHPAGGQQLQSLSEQTAQLAALMQKAAAHASERCTVDSVRDVDSEWRRGAMHAETLFEKLGQPPAECPTADPKKDKVLKLGQTLAAHSARPLLGWMFIVTSGTEVGFAHAPGGFVFVTRALVDQYDEPALASVLAHEIAAVCSKHLFEQLLAGDRAQCQVAAQNEYLEANAPRGMVLPKASSAQGSDFTRGLMAQMSGQMAGLGLSSQAFALDADAVRMLAFAGFAPSDYERSLPKLVAPGNTLGPKLDERAAKVRALEAELAPFLK